MKSSVLLLCCLFAHAFTAAAELVKTCDVGSKAGSRVDAVRDSKIADTYVYYLRQNGSTRPFFEDRESSRGSPGVRIVVASSDEVKQYRGRAREKV